MKHAKRGSYIALCGIVAFGAIASKGQSPELEQVLRTLGYGIERNVNVAPTDRENSEFHMRAKRRYFVKSVRPVPGERNLYYRFVVDIETLGDQVVADRRFRFIEETTPGPNTKMEPEGTYREAFRRGNVVYVVSTAVYKFVLDKDLSRLREELDSRIVDFGEPLGCCGPVQTVKIEATCRSVEAGKKRYLSYFVTFNVLSVLSGRYDAKEIVVEAIPTPWAVSPNVDATNLLKMLRIDPIRALLVRTFRWC